MKKTFCLYLFLLPISCFAQFVITGRVLNQLNSKPLSNVNIFISNTTIGDKTSGDGTFLLKGTAPGKYNLVISMVGFETVIQPVNISDANLKLPDILLNSKTIALNEVTVKSTPDSEREGNYQLFKDEFLGSSRLVDDCKIVNPELLDLYYNKKDDVLMATSVDFLKIKNNSLGYNIRYLLKDFKLDRKPTTKIRLSSTGSVVIEPIRDTIAKKFRLGYTGSILFEEMTGTTSQVEEWKKAREKVYRGSVMHFLRSLLENRLDEEGFKVLRMEEIENPDRPNDSLVQAKNKFYETQKSLGNNQRDSLSFWVKKAKLPKMVTKLNLKPLYKKDIVSYTTEPGQFALSAGKMNDELFITYNTRGHFDYNFRPEYINSPNNKETTLVKFTKGYAIFDSNGWLAPDSVVFSGIWGVKRVPELLPLNYQLSSRDRGPGIEQGNPKGAVSPNTLKDAVFYKPQYNTSNLNNSIVDYRSSVGWKSRFAMDTNGQAKTHPM